jgi:hypothetical protein
MKNHSFLFLQKYGNSANPKNCCCCFVFCLLLETNSTLNDGLVIALRPQTPKHIKGGWSHYTDTRETN